MPNLDHLLHTWGRLAYVYKRKRDRESKFDPKAHRGIFVGYKTRMKDGFLIYLPELNKLKVSRDVRVFEHLSYDDLFNLPQLQGPEGAEGEEHGRSDLQNHPLVNQKRMLVRSERREFLRTAIPEVVKQTKKDTQEGQEKCADQQPAASTSVQRPNEQIEVDKPLNESKRPDAQNIYEQGVARCRERRTPKLPMYLAKHYIGEPSEEEGETEEEINCPKCGALHVEPPFGQHLVLGGRVNLHKPHKKHLCSCGAVFTLGRKSLGIIPRRTATHLGDIQPPWYPLSRLGEVLGECGRSMSVDRASMQAHPSAAAADTDEEMPQLVCEADVCPPLAFPPNWTAPDIEIHNERLDMIDMSFADIDVCFFAGLEPCSYQEVLRSPEKAEWLEAMNKEHTSIVKKHVRECVPITEATSKILPCKWVYKQKPDKKKARLVVRGDYQEFDELRETYAATLSNLALNVFVVLSLMTDRRLYQFDVSTAFLNSPLSTPVFIQIPEGFREGLEGMCWKLLRAMYGLQEAPHEWHKTLITRLTEMGFEQCVIEPCLLKHTERDLWLVIFVDDFLLAPKAGSEERDRQWFIEQINETFEVTFLDEADVYLGIKFTREGNTLTLTQPKHIKAMLTRYHLDGDDVRAHPTPYTSTSMRLSKEQSPHTEWQRKQMARVPVKPAVGSLMYLTVFTRPDIFFAVKEAARYTNNPGRAHWTWVKTILRYVKATQGLGLTYTKTGTTDKPLEVIAFADASWQDQPDSKSSAGYLVYLCGNLIDWRSHTQRCVSKSTCHAEYTELSDVGDRVVDCSNIVNFLGYKTSNALVFTDSHSAKDCAYGEKIPKKLRGLDLRAHHIRHLSKQGICRVLWCPSEEPCGSDDQASVTATIRVPAEQNIQQHHQRVIAL